MRNNDFCVNDKQCGSVWGKRTTWEELDEISRTCGNTIEFMEMLNDWNGKRYVFMRDDRNSQNYLIEVGMMEGEQQ